MRQVSKAESDSVSVALICQNTLVREGLRRILDEENFRLSSSVASSEMLLEAVGDSAPQVIIVDSGAIKGDCQKIAALRSNLKDSRIVVLSDGFEIGEMLDAFHAGAQGYLLKEIGCAALIGSLQLVVLGEQVMPSELIQRLPQYVMNHPVATITKPEFAETLSEREEETLRCLVLGCANKVIARRLDISEATVKVHVKAILRKLDVQNRTQAAIWAVNNGVVPQQIDAYNPATPLPIVKEVERVPLESEL